MSCRSDFWRNDAALLCTLVIGYYLGGTVAIALHEFGHVLGGLGQVSFDRVVLHPFADSSVLAMGDGSLLFQLGGVMFGSFLAILCVFLANCAATPGNASWLFLYFVGIMGMALNGTYLFLGSLAPYGDAATLLSLGVPRLVLLSLGLVLLTFYLGLSASLFERVGLGAPDRWWRCLLGPQVALFLYFAMVYGYREFIGRQNNSVWFWLRFTLCLQIGALFAAILAFRRTKRRQNPNLPWRRVRWLDALSGLCLQKFVNQEAVFS